MIPAALTQRYNRLKEIGTARNLIASIEQNGLGADLERQFLQEKIQDLQRQLDDTAGDVQQIIEQMTDYQARIYTSLHYQIGYEWSEIANMFKVSLHAVKTRVYRYLSKLEPSDALQRGKP